MSLLHIPFTMPVNESASRHVSPPGTIRDFFNLRLTPNGSYRKVLSPVSAPTVLNNIPGDSSAISEVLGSIDRGGTQYINASTNLGDNHVYKVDGTSLIQLGSVSRFIPSHYQRIASNMAGFAAPEASAASLGDFFSLNGYDFVAVTDASASTSSPTNTGYVVVVSARERATGRVVAEFRSGGITTEKSGARIVSCGTVVIAFVPSATSSLTIRQARIETSPIGSSWTFTTAFSSPSVALTLDPSAWDVAPYDSTKVVAAYKTAASGTYGIRFIFSNGTVGPETLLTIGDGGSVSIDARADLGVIALVVTGSTGTHHIQLLDSALAPTASNSFTGFASPRKPRVLIRDATNCLVISSGVGSATVPTQFARATAFDIFAGLIATSENIGGRPVGRPFFLDGQMYCFFCKAAAWRAYGGTLLLARFSLSGNGIPSLQPQSTYLEFSNQYDTIFAGADSVAGNVVMDPERGILIGLPVVTSPLWQSMASGSDEEEIGHAFDVFGLRLATSNAASGVKTPQLCMSRDGVIVPGGVTSVIYPDETVTQLGIPGEPDLYLAPSLTGGGLTLNGTYNYSAHYEWQDPNGRKTRSAVSFPLPIVLTSTTQAVDVYSGPFLPSNKTSTLGIVKVVLTRTTNSGQVFYSATNDAFGISYVGGVSRWLDALSDVNITRKDTLYTEGGVLSDDPPPPCALSAFGAGRLWVAGQFDPHKVTASKTVDDRYPIAFSVAPEFSFFVPSPVTALWVMDGALVIFSEDAIFVQSGDGPDARGQGKFPEPRRIPSSIGCVNHRSMVEVPDGLIFYHKSAFWLLPRGFGAPVRISDAIKDSASNLDVLSAVATQDEDGRAIVMFFTSWLDYLMLDLQLNSWSVVENSHAIAYASRAGAYVSGLTSLATSIVNGWGDTGQYQLGGWFTLTAIRPNGVLGQAQIRALALLTEYRGDAAITVSVFVDGTWKELDKFEVSARRGDVTGHINRRVIELSDKLRDQEAVSVWITDAAIVGSAYTQGPIYHGMSVEYTARDSLVLVEAKDHV